MFRPSLIVSLSIVLLCFTVWETKAQRGTKNRTNEIIKQDSTDTDDEDLMALVEGDTEEHKSGREYATATFKATRLMNGHSIENVGAGVLDFRVAHRFNSINTGLKDFFGLDGAVTRLGLDYGITDWLMIGVGRSTFEKEVDGLIKAKILRQTTDNHMPISVSYLGTMAVKTGTAPAIPAGTTYYFSNRLTYANVLIVARKFSEAFSLQLMPAHVHYNIVPKASDPNNIFALGFGGRIKLNKRVSLNGEYYYQLPSTRFAGTYNSFALGFDIETGGHVFQLHFTNSTGMTERTYIGQTTGSWGKGDIRFGFNISRVFTIVRPKEFR